MRASICATTRAACALIALAAMGCAAGQPQSDVQPQAQAQPAEIKAAYVVPDPDHIMIQSGRLATPYQQLGPLAYTEPFSPRAIDEDHIDDRLKTMAIAKWGSDVDAIVGVTTALSADSSEVNVTVEAVKVIR